VSGAGDRLAVTFTVPGPPVGKGRPRMTRRGHTYTPQKTIDAEERIAAEARSALDRLAEGPVRLTVWATFQPAKSWPKYRRAAALGSFHTQKPDVDNLGKLVADALNGIAYADDSQIAEIVCRKIWGPSPSTVVMIEELPQ